MNKLKAFLLTSVFCCLHLTLISNESVRNSIYISPSYNSPSANYGYPVGYDDGISINKYGYGFSIGYIYYFTNNDTLLNYGIDLAILDMNHNKNIVPSRQERFIGSRITSINIGPIVSIVPKNKFRIDIYSQGAVGYSKSRIYNPETNFINRSDGRSIQYRFATGIRIGYNMLYYTFEYNWGQPKLECYVGYPVEAWETTTYNFNQNYFKFGFSFIIPAFK